MLGILQYPLLTGLGARFVQVDDDLEFAYGLGALLKAARGKPKLWIYHALPMLENVANTSLATPLRAPYIKPPRADHLS